MLVSTQKDRILQLISDIVPVGSAQPSAPQTIARLTDLTNELIDSCGRETLETDPFTEVYLRQVPVDYIKIGEILQDKTILVTGGHGFVGSNLVARLRQCGARKIVVVDIVTSSSAQIFVNTGAADWTIPVQSYECDVRDRDRLAQIFEQEQPQVVFHLAAQRLPGLAETQVYRTLSTSLLGAQNIIDLCETHGVEICVFSSTGKASRYFTPDIYAGSKKIAEWLFSDHSRPKKCQYGIVRFTHVVENSPISAELDQRIAEGIVSMHAPDRYIYAQNIEESVSLLLKTLAIVEPDQTNMLAVRDLSWPINTLDVALHKILQAGGNIPLYFKGLPLGYEQHVFMGQLDLSGSHEVLPMLNVLETDRSQVCPDSNTVIFTIAPFDPSVLEESVQNISAAVTDEEIRQSLIQGIKNVALSVFMRADRQSIQNILKWGTSEEELAANGVDIGYHQDTIELLTQAINANSAVPMLEEPAKCSTLNFEQRPKGSPRDGFALGVAAKQRPAATVATSPPLVFNELGPQQKQASVNGSHLVSA